MKWQHIKEYFIFSRRERTGVIVLVILIVIVYSIPEFIPEKNPYYLDKGADTLFQIIETRTSKGGRLTEHDSNVISIDGVEANRSRFFTFDPNTLSDSGWKALGVRDKTIRTIINFRAKGGRFHTASDIRKIFGMSEMEADQLIPYVRIKSAESRSNQYARFSTDSSFFRSPRKTNRTIESIEINAADSIQFIALPGIGAKLASRIINFRNSLGGFYSVNQISETFGLTDSTFASIKAYLTCDESRLQKININTADISTLKSHPYIRWNFANAIVRYRQQHGMYSSVKDLLKIEIISEVLYNKVAPYLVTE